MLKVGLSGFERSGAPDLEKFGVGARFPASSGMSGSKAGRLAGGFGRSGASDAILRTFGDLGFERSGAPGLRKIRRGDAIFHEFGQVGEIRRLGGTRFWRVWQLGCDFSSVWADAGDSQVRRHAVLEGLAAGVRVFISLGTSRRFAG